MGRRTGGGLTATQFKVIERALKSYGKRKDNKVSEEECAEIISLIGGYLRKPLKKKLILRMIKENYMYGDHAEIGNNFFESYGIPNRTLQEYINELRDEGKIRIVYERLGKKGGMKRYISLVEDEEVTEVHERN